MPPNPPPKPQSPSIMQQAEAARNILVFPALTVMVFLRRDLGYRIVSPRTFGSVAMFLVIFSLVAECFTNSLKTYALLVFGIVSFAFAMKQRLKRWREIQQGVLQHSFYIGTSPFHFARLPAFLERHRRVERFVDPIACFLIGTAMMFFLPGLGFWIAGAGAGLRVYEDEVYQKETNRQLDMLDGLINSENQSNVVERFEEGPRTGEARPDTSVPTGLADDIQERLKRRKAKQPPTPKG